MAGSKSSLTGEDFYGAYEAQETANKYARPNARTAHPARKAFLCGSSAVVAVFPPGERMTAGSHAKFLCVLVDGELSCFAGTQRS